MATMSSLRRPTNSSFLHAIRAERTGIIRSAPSSLCSFSTRSSRQNLLYMVPLAGPISLKTSPPSRLSSVEALMESTPPPPSLLASRVGFRLMSVGLPSHSWSSNRERPNVKMRRIISLECAAGNDGNVESSALNEEDTGFLSPGWPIVGAALFGLGCLFGPPLDGIHSRVQLQVYDNGAIDFFGLRTNIWVPPMLGVFYSLGGLLQLALDKKFAPKDNVPTSSLTKVALSFISLVVLLELSAELYQAGVPFNIEGYILFFFAELNWLLLENTWWGFGLAVVIGVVCPLAELPVLKHFGGMLIATNVRAPGESTLFGLWHYPRANVSLFNEGFISWVICCYFFYTPFISNLARWLSNYQKDRAKLKE